MPFLQRFSMHSSRRNPIGRSRGPIRHADAQGQQPLRPLPIPLGEDRLVLRRAGEGHLLLLRLPQGRRRDQLHHGDRVAQLSDAVRFLAKRAGLEVPEDEEYRAQYKRTERLYALCKDAARWFRKQLLADAGREARDYIVKRGLSTQTVNRFGLGFSPNEWSALMDAMQKQGYTQKELLDAGLAVNGKKGRRL